MEFWSDVLERIRWKIPRASYDMWFARTEAKLDGEVLSIITENQFSRDWLNSRYKKMIALTVEETLGYKVDIQIVSKDSYEKEKIQSSLQKAPYEEIKSFIVQQNMTINKLQKKVRELEEKVVHLEQLDRIM